MALEFARSTVISRTAGHTAIKAAAYRAGENLMDERIGRIANYSHRASDVGHNEILLPVGADTAMADRSTLWASVEEREDQHNRRDSARLAVDNVIALPVELTPAQHIDMAKAFAVKEFVSRGLAVDLAVHYHSKGNPHAHLMVTTRPLVGSVFGLKDRGMAGKFYAGVKIADEVQLRHRWADYQNAYFLKNGIDACVHNHNGEYQAEVHLGSTHAMQKKGLSTARQEQNDQIITAREQALLAHPEIIIERVSDRKSLFTKHDLYRELHQLTQNALVFANIKPVLDAHDSLIAFTLKDKEYVTTQAVLEAEMDIRMLAAQLAKRAERFSVPSKVLMPVLDRYSFLSAEQREAAMTLADGKCLGVVVGLAGAGKSTMLKALREGYESQGFRVRGIALAGKAAEELQQSAGIESRTIASWLLAIEQGRELLNDKDVLTLDEAGMVNNTTMKRVLGKVEQAGAKLIMIGDAEQLQPIQAGGPFRDIATQEGFTEIGTIRRQSTPWQRQATKDLSQGRGVEALAAYQSRGHVQRHPDSAAAVAQLVSDYHEQSVGSKIVLAHRNVDVDSLNCEIRASLVAAGDVESGEPFRAQLSVTDEVVSTPFDLRPGDDIQFTVTDKTLTISAGDHGTYIGFDAGVHHVRKANGEEIYFDNSTYAHIDHRPTVEADTVLLGAGDRVLFTRNDRQLDVKNGSLGTVIGLINGLLQVKLDGATDTISFNFDEYADVSYGYATTIHKSQGMTVDHSFVFGSATMDKHLGYVALSRHKESATVYLSDTAMKGRSFGQTISRANRQETVLDLAEKHGLELDLRHPDAFRFTSISTNTTEVMMDTVANSEGSITDLTNEVSVSADTAVAVASAKRVLEKETRLGLAELERRHKSILAPLIEVSKETERRLAIHTLQRPKEKGLFSSKAAMEKWASTKRALEIEHGNAKRAMVREMDSFRAKAGEHQFIAEARARKKHPAAAREISQADARAQARSLLDRCRIIERDLTQAISKSDAHTVSALRESLDHVLNQLHESDAIKATLSTEKRAVLEHTRVVNSTQLEQARALDKGRGLGR